MIFASSKELSLFLTASILLALIFVSCNNDTQQFNHGFNFSKEDEVKIMGDMLDKHITADMMVYEITFRQSNTELGVSMSKDGATIVYLHPEIQGKLIGLDVDLRSGKASVNDFYEQKYTNQHINYKGANLKGYDYTLIAKAVSGSLQSFVNEKIQIDGIGDYRICFNNEDLSKANHYFKLQDCVGTTTNGGHKKDVFDDYNIKTDAEGNIIKN